MRARNIKPGFFKNEDLAECKPLARLLFIGLWCMSLREGIVEYRPKKIKAEIFPYEDGKCNIEELLDQLKKFQLITILVHQDTKHQIIYLPTFLEHQSPHRNEKSCNIKDLDLYQEITGNSDKVISPLLNDERGMMNDERGMSNIGIEKPDFISSEEWVDLIKSRKEKKLSLSKAALTPFVNRIKEAVDLGYDVRECLDEFCQSKWTRFNVEWMPAKKGVGNHNSVDIKPKTVRDARIMANDSMAKQVLEARRNEQSDSEDQEADTGSGKNRNSKSQLSLS